MSRPSNRCWHAVLVVLAALGAGGCEKQAPVAQAPPPAAVAAPAAETGSLTPAEEKHLVDMAKARKAADGATVWEVIQNAEQQRPAKFKVAIVDLEYKKDGTPAAVTVCYWIGARRLEDDQSCRSIGWEIAADKQTLQPYNTTATQAVEAGRDALLQAVDQMYGKKCDAAAGAQAAAKVC